MGFDKPIKNTKIFDLNRKKNPPFQMDQAEISSERMRMVIRLSSAQYVETVKKSLSEALPDVEFEEHGDEITVSLYPPQANEANVMAIVQKQDPRAVLQ